MTIQERKKKFEDRTKKISIDEFYSFKERMDEGFHDYLEKKLWPIVGATVTSFNSLESGLDFALSDLMDKEEDFSHVIIKRMMFRGKVELLIDLLRVHSHATATFTLEEVKELKEKLNFANTLRNRIIHSDWESMNTEDYVKSKLEVKEGKGIQFVLTRFTLEQLMNDAEFIDDVSAQIWTSDKFRPPRI